MSYKYNVLIVWIWGTISPNTPKSFQKERGDGIQGKLSEERSGLHLLQINHLLLGLVLRPVERPEGRKGDAQIHISGKHKCAILPYVSLDACLFQAPQSIDAAIILSILLFSANDQDTLAWNQFLTFKLWPHPRWTSRFSFTTAARRFLRSLPPAAKVKGALNAKKIL